MAEIHSEGVQADQAPSSQRVLTPAEMPIDYVGVWRSPASWIAPPVGVIAVVLGASGGFGAASFDFDGLGEVIGMTTFIFGILLAFSLERSRSRLAAVAEMLKRQDAALASIRSLVVEFSEDESDIARLIDLHLQDQVDYRLVDYVKTAASFGSLADRIRDIRPNGSREELVYDHLLGATGSLGADRSQLEAMVGRSVTLAEWVGLIALLAVQLMLIALVGSMGLLAALTGALVAAVLVLLFHVLWKLDRLRFQEDAWVWTPLSSLFEHLGDEPPYYPAPAVGDRRCEPRGVVRIATYGHGYPDMSGKEIALVRFEP